MAKAVSGFVVSDYGCSSCVISSFTWILTTVMPFHGILMECNDSARIQKRKERREGRREGGREEGRSNWRIRLEAMWEAGRQVSQGLKVPQCIFKILVAYNFIECKCIFPSNYSSGFLFSIMTAKIVNKTHENCKQQSPTVLVPKI